MAAVPFVANEFRCVKIAAVSALVIVIVASSKCADASPKIMLVATVKSAPPAAY